MDNYITFKKKKKVKTYIALQGFCIRPEAVRTQMLISMENMLDPIEQYEQLMIEICW